MKKLSGILALALLFLSVYSEAQVRADSQINCTAQNGEEISVTVSTMVPSEGLVLKSSKQDESKTVPIVSEDSFFDETDLRTRSVVGYDSENAIEAIQIVIDGNPNDLILYGRTDGKTNKLFFYSDVAAQYLDVTANEFLCR